MTEVASDRKKVAVLEGDAIGPEIMAPVDFAVRMILSVD